MPTLPVNHCWYPKVTGAFLQAGVSELTMATIMNGMAAHGGVIPVCGTFFVFSDYMKPSVRLAALMELPVKFVWSHDAFRVGEDGPTHQPVEQEAQIRLLEKMKNHSGEISFLALRPADADAGNFFVNAVVLDYVQLKAIAMCGHAQRLIAEEDSIAMIQQYLVAVNKIVGILVSDRNAVSAVSLNDIVPEQAMPDAPAQKQAISTVVAGETVAHRRAL